LTNIKYRDTINEIIKHEEGITMATKALMRITRSDREWAYRESKLKYELDRQSLIYETKREGIAEGQKSKALDIARNMKSLNLSADVIAKTTGLSLEEINSL
jgi:predicted transposase/invertase (TIGR01784 family)